MTSKFPAVLTVASLARRLGLSTHLTHKALEAAGVPLRKCGAYPVIYLIDLRRMNPDLYESMRLRDELTADAE